MLPWPVVPVYGFCCCVEASTRGDQPGLGLGMAVGAGTFDLQNGRSIRPRSRLRILDGRSMWKCCITSDPAAAAAPATSASMAASLNLAVATTWLAVCASSTTEEETRLVAAAVFPADSSAAACAVAATAWCDTEDRTISTR